MMLKIVKPWRKSVVFADNYTSRNCPFIYLFIQFCNHVSNERVV